MKGSQGRDGSGGSDKGAAAHAGHSGKWAAGQRGLNPLRRTAIESVQGAATLTVAYRLSAQHAWPQLLAAVIHKA